MAGSAVDRSPECLVFPARSRECLPLCHRKRCAPNRGVWLRTLANSQNCDAWRVQSTPMPNGPLQQDYAYIGREPPPNRAPWLMRSYASAPLLWRSLPPCSPGKRRSLRAASPIALDSTNRRHLEDISLRYETARSPSARSEDYASRIVVRPRNRLNKKACRTKRDRLRA